jgi:hypothetical protein
MIELNIDKPIAPPAHREVVKVIRRVYDDDWEHPGGRYIEHIWRPDGYHGERGSWDWMPPGTNPQWSCSGYQGSWNTLVYFSDGTLGVIEHYQVEVALAALNVRLLSPTTT